MKQIKNLQDLKSHLRTEEAFTEEINFKGFPIWWNVDGVVGIPHPHRGYFRCDPSTDREYLDFYKLQDREFGGYEWVLS